MSGKAYAGTNLVITNIVEGIASLLEEYHLVTKSTTKYPHCVPLVGGKSRARMFLVLDPPYCSIRAYDYFSKIRVESHLWLMACFKGSMHMASSLQGR